MTYNYFNMANAGLTVTPGKQILMASENRAVRQPKRLCQGISIIETLLILLFATIMLAGLNTFNGKSSYASKTNYSRDQAHVIANEMAQRIQANAEGVLTGAYNIKAGETPAIPANDCSAKSCDPTATAAVDIAEVYHSAQERLPNAQLQIGMVLGKVVQIRVLWGDQRNGVNGTGCNANDATDMACTLVNVAVAGVSRL